MPHCRSWARDVVLVLGLLAAVSGGADVAPPEVRFLFRDAGETLAMSPVAAALVAELNASVTILALTENAANLVGNLTNFTGPKVVTLPMLGIGWDALPERDSTLVPSDLASVLGALACQTSQGGETGHRHASGVSGGGGRQGGHCMLLTGMVSAAQLQLTTALPEAAAAGGGQYKIAYDDGFGLWNPNGSLPLYLPLVDELFVAADLVADGARGDPLMPSPPRPVTVVGNPTLRVWEQFASDPAALAALRFSLFGGDARPLGQGECTALDQITTKLSAAGLRHTPASD